MTNSRTETSAKIAIACPFEERRLGLFGAGLMVILTMSAQAA